MRDPGNGVEANNRFKGYNNHTIARKFPSPCWNSDVKYRSSCTPWLCCIFQKKATHTIAFHQLVWMQPSSKKDKRDC